MLLQRQHPARQHVPRSLVAADKDEQGFVDERELVKTITVDLGLDQHADQVLGSLVAGGLLLVAFVAWESRAANPMMPLSLFRNRGFSATSAAILFTNVGMFGVIFLISQFLQSVLGYSPLEAGVHGLPWTAAPAATAPVAGLLSDRLGARRIVAIGIALQAVGIGWLAGMITPTIAYIHLVPPFLIAGTGLGFFFAPITRLALSYAPEPLEGIASGTSNALRQVGTVLGVALTVAGFVLGAGAIVVLMAPEPRPEPPSGGQLTPSGQATARPSGVYERTEVVAHD